MDFSEAYVRYARDIEIAALSQRVPGLDHDDVVQEMLGCLWKACERFTEGNFPSYWWSIWLNRRTDLTRRQLHRYPTPVILRGEPEHFGRADTYVPPPPGSNRLEVMVWRLLAHGFERQDVVEVLGITKRRYYELLHGWRREDVRESLRHTL